MIDYAKKLYYCLGLVFLIILEVILFIPVFRFNFTILDTGIIKIHDYIWFIGWNIAIPVCIIIISIFLLGYFLFCEDDGFFLREEIKSEERVKK